VFSSFTPVLYHDPDAAAPGGTRPIWEAPSESLIVAPGRAPIAARPVEVWG